MKYLRSPNLPEGRVDTVLISSQADTQMIRSLESFGIRMIHIHNSAYLEPPVASHPDLLFHHLGNNLIMAIPPDEDTDGILRELNFDPVYVNPFSDQKYPANVALDAARIGNYLICNPKYTNQKILAYCEKNGITTIPVNQGYAKCSVCVVDDHSIITADPRIAIAAEKNGMSVLKITEGYIKLPGYPYGFIGGCSGKLAPDVMAFAGKLSTHPDYKGITEFLNDRGIAAQSLCDGQLTDIGGIIPLTER